MANPKLVKAALQDYQEIENGLRDRLQYLAADGNVFLLLDNYLESVKLEKIYADQLRIHTNYQDRLAILRQIPSLVVLAGDLKDSTDYALTEADTKKLERVAITYDPEQVPDSYAFLRRIIQLLATVNLALQFTKSYTFRGVPPLQLQNQLATNLEDVDFGAQQIYIDLPDFDFTNKGGQLDLQKFINYEKEDYKLAVYLSSQQHSFRVADVVLPTIDELDSYPELGEILYQGLQNAYLVIYSFIYQQRRQNNLPLNEIALNVAAKFGNARQFILKSLDMSISNFLSEFSGSLADRLKKQFTTLYREAETSSQLVPKTLFDWYVYDLNVRKANEFESKYFYAQLAVDLAAQLDPELEEQTVVSTLVATWHPDLLTLAAFAFCGADVNTRFAEEYLYLQTADIFEKYTYAIGRRWTSVSDQLNEANSLLDIIYRLGS